MSVTGQERISLERLTKAITWLDGYRACYCVDPRKIEGIFRRYPKRNMRRLWREVKSDIYKIAQLPASVPEIVRMYRVLSILRTLLPVLGIVSMTLWFITMEARALPIFQTLFKITVLASLINVISYLVLNWHVYKKIMMCYEEHLDSIKGRRRRVKHVTQLLINEFRSHVKKYRYDPKEYAFKLIHTDYDNIEVVKEEGRKAMLHSMVGKVLSKFRSVLSVEKRETFLVIVKTKG